MPTRLIIGLMSGTSVDAIDAALVRITTTPDHRYRAKVLHHTELPWPKPLRTRLLAAMAPATTTTAEICQLNFLIAHHFALAVEKLLTDSHTDRKKITALASHGQTVCHLPPQRTEPKGLRTEKKRTQSSVLSPQSYVPSTLQLGDPSVLATLTRITTVANFRTADVALGGQGAPLVPFADDLLLSHPTKSRAIQNIGGIANVTFLPPLSPQSSVLSPRTIRAFDTGPGNMLLDATISLVTNNKKRYDHNGQLAAKGTLDTALLRHLQSNPYFQIPPPKSTGRELFGLPLAQQIHAQIENRKLKIENALNTLTRLTAWSIAHAYRTHLPHLPDEVILCGGGANNPTLIQMLKEEITPKSSALSTQHSALINIDHFGIPNKSKEAASFALLGAATLDHRPANLPSVTAASRPTILGTISPQ